jgi:hypothetical protein
MFAQATIMKMIAQCTQSGKSINAAMDWAESEIEGFMRSLASKTRTGGVRAAGPRQAVGFCRPQTRAHCGLVPVATSVEGVRPLGSV